MVQEYVPGGDFQHLSVAVALDSHARPVTSFVARKRRQGNRGAGVGTFVESHQDDEAAGVARRFLSRIGYVGVAEMELKRHGITGELFAIEVNPRLWSQVMLPAALGLDFALLAYRIARGAAPSGELPSAPERAVSWQDLWGDSYWTFRPEGYFWRGDVSASRWLMETLSCCVHPFFEWRDPVPAMVRLWQEAAGHGRQGVEIATLDHGGAPMLDEKPLSCEILETPEAIAGEAAAWNAIVDEGYDGYPCLTAEWYLLWLRHFATPDTRILAS